MGVLYGYPFIHNRLWVTTLFLCLLAIAESAEAIMLMVFNVHRALLFLRPNGIKLFYLVTTPLAVLYVAALAATDILYVGISDFCSYGLFVIILVIVIVCYVVLRRHFRRSNYSEKAKRLQNKLSNGLLLQIIVHIITLILVSAIGPGIVYLCVALSVDVKLIVTIVSSYMVIVYMMFAWYPVIIGFIIKWSISGFLTTRKGQITTIVVDRTTTPKPMKH
ncbi:hypothetical protein Q1695_014624 [Nippostrongylus brasiliensis]|nr:hypothetical protein Q1695_014624 [Nippostrongylus brasiliensis]